VQNNLLSVKYDENDLPLWALIYTVFRAGRRKTLELIFRLNFYIRNYKGNIKTKEMEKYLMKYYLCKEND
jgi:hypothetical protein